MLYHYIATDSAGKLTEADYDAESLGQILQHIASIGLRPISIKALKEERRQWGVFSEGISMSDKVFLTKYLSLMLRAGTDLLSAINILIADFDKSAVKNFLLEVRDNLSKGRPFYEAFAKYPRTFSLTFVNLVKAAEASGNLQETFDELSVTLAREYELRGKVRSAMIYPIILFVMSISIVSFLLLFALPKIATAFSQSGIKPPLFTEIVFGIGFFLNAHLVLILSILAIIVGPGLLFLLKTVAGRTIFEYILDHLPLVNKVRREMALQRFASTYKSLLQAGMPILEATKITADAVGLMEFKISLIRIADEGLAKGLTVGEAFKKEPAFPKVVTNLMSISEKGGRLEDVLGTLSDFYTNTVETTVSGLVAVLEPVLLLVMGGLVGLIALSIIVPIYQLATQF